MAMLILTLALLAGGCSGNETPEAGTALVGRTDVSEVALSFVEAVELSDCAAVAELAAVHETAASVEYEFMVKEVLRGEIPEKRIFLVNLRNKDAYTVGEEYLLIMNRHDSLFYDYPLYTTFTGIHIPAHDTAAGTMYGEAISRSYAGDIKELLREAAFTEKEQGVHYTTSDDMATVVAESEFILEVKVKELPEEGRFNGSPYYCELISILKGGEVNFMESGDIIVTLMKGSVELGGTYIVMANRSGDDSRVHVQSSLKSVIPISDAKMIEEITNLIKAD
ncbi:MAG: hypothetical protein LBI19_08290 [Oscillospiraceae bacterium]|nr:hypothetical protein [Oscillospiraceae bacterium]